MFLCYSLQLLERHGIKMSDGRINNVKNEKLSAAEIDSLTGLYFSNAFLTNVETELET